MIRKTNNLPCVDYKTKIAFDTLTKAEYKCLLTSTPIIVMNRIKVYNGNTKVCSEYRLKDFLEMEYISIFNSNVSGNDLTSLILNN